MHGLTEKKNKSFLVANRSKVRRFSLAVPTYQLPFQKRFRKRLCLPLQIRLSGKCLESQWPTESAPRPPWSS